MPHSGTRPPAGLAARLRSATRELHARVERSGVMRQLLKGQVERATYVRLLRNLHAIYAALEDGLARHAGHARLGTLVPAALRRREALAADLRHLHGPHWAQAWPLEPEAARYVQRLEALVESEPLRLAAHAYVRYLGDLSGGQIVARLLAGRLQLSEGAGLHFYDFGDAAQVAALGHALRTALDGIGDEPGAADAVVDEACRAFEMHARLFEQLGGAAPGDRIAAVAPA